MNGVQGPMSEKQAFCLICTFQEASIKCFHACILAPEKQGKFSFKILLKALCISWTYSCSFHENSEL